MDFDTFLKSVSKIENLELPGLASQVKMSPPYRLELNRATKRSDENELKMAGVLALFYPDKSYKTSLF